MTEWTFRLTLRSIELTDEQLDTLHEAGCDDGSFSVEPDGTVLGFSDREAPTEQDAVISTIVDIERAGISARVLRVQADDDWPTASEIAARVGRSRQSVALLARGERGPRDFPAPSPRLRTTSSGGTHTHDSTNRVLPQQVTTQAWANNVPPAGSGGPHQCGTTVMITVLVPKVTRCVTFGTKTVIMSPRPPSANTYCNTCLTAPPGPSRA